MSSKARKNSEKRQDGFTLIEAVIAILIITIGLIGTAAAITYALEFTTTSRNVSSAKLVIVASIEEIESLRNSRRLDFRQIANVGAVDNTNTPSRFNGFSAGFKDVSIDSGPDGVNGTDDDLRAPGVDGVYGTADDFDNQALIRSGYQRQITISNLSDTLKKVEIKVKYMSSNGKIGELTGVCYLNDEARVTR
ncbi:MAG TPA: prepilin-type N-terminal cleavage/methylation domain-containing protein [Pyrinomonadaceae bacterium]|jgi:type II secretory pathway pseudopilin PulG